MDIEKAKRREVKQDEKGIEQKGSCQRGYLLG